jgi:hypothetical protein
LPVNRSLAGVAVSEVEGALGWYDALLGRPADARPMDGLAEWRARGGGVLQLVEDDQTSDKVLFATVTDPEANTMTLVEGR